MKAMLVFAGILLIPLTGLTQTTWYVPDDFPAGIQAAISDPSVVNGDTVIVRPGTYVEHINFVGKAVHLKSEMGPDVTIIDGNGGPVVRFISGEGEDSVLDGFTITNGKCGAGGGINCYSSSPTIKNNIITGNKAIYPYGIGGGIYCSRSLAKIENNIISNNSAEMNGGGICCEYGVTVIIVENSIISHNNGGAITFDYQTKGSFNNCIINDNENGCPLNISYDCVVGFTNCTFYNNSDTSVLSENSCVNISNTIYWGNGGISIGGSGPYSPTLSIWCSDIEGGQSSIYVSNGTLNWGPGMIDADPLLDDPSNGDFHLTWLSPCRNSGDTTPHLPPEDFEGDPRVAEDVVDMGADEFYLGPGVYPVLDIKCNGEDEDVMMNSGDNVVLTIDVDPKDYSSYPFDVWVLVRNDASNYRSYSPVEGWKKGWSTEYYSGPLPGIVDTVLDRVLPPGTYKAWLAIDTKANGNLNVPQVIGFDMVDITVQ